VMYRTDLFDKAGLKMPESPTWDFVVDAAKKLTDKSGGVYGICETCGRPIAPERLAARPAARTCIDCAR